MKLIKLNTDHYIIVDHNGVDIYTTQENTIVPHIPLSEVKELLGEVDVEKKAKDIFPPKNSHFDRLDEVDGNAYYRSIWKGGYNQALEDNKDKKYTEEDMLWAYKEGENVRYSKVGEAVLQEKFIRSLQPPTSWEIEIVNGKIKLK